MGTVPIDAIAPGTSLAHSPHLWHNSRQPLTPSKPHSSPRAAQRLLTLHCSLDEWYHALGDLKLALHCAGPRPVSIERK